MLAAAKFFTILIFIIINFLILFTVKSRTTTVTSLIIAHLVAVLFFSISIASNDAFKEMVLGLIIYSMVILFLISNYDEVFSIISQASKIKDWKRLAIFFTALGFFVTVMFLAIFSITKNIQPLAIFINEKKLTLQSEIAANPVIAPSHSAHLAVKKFYLGKNSTKTQYDETADVLEVNDRKMGRLKDELMENFLLKRSSDMILIIVAISSILLLLLEKKTKPKNESL